jgi:hypothetical protein
MMDGKDNILLAMALANELTPQKTIPPNTFEKDFVSISFSSSSLSPFPSQLVPISIPDSSRKPSTVKTEREILTGCEKRPQRLDYTNNFISISFFLLQQL